MEEVQSWWEVPAVAHFCYVFRSPFNLIFFEIAELESALLNIQDPDMSISLDQLIIRLLQGCYDEDSVNDGNWEEKLHELFNDNFDEGENIFNDSCHFYNLTPRLRIEVLLKLCELRLDVEGALEDIKDIPSEDMQAKCIGKDSQNNTYWYFCDERLYKENDSSGKKQVQVSKAKDTKSKSSKNSRQSAREKRSKATPMVDQSWMVACFTLTDWENLLKSFSKSKNSQEKELSASIKKHLPLLQEKVAEKDRLLRKRFLELAPKRSSSRISKVQEKRKLEELKAAEEARIAKEKAEKERAMKEALMLKEKKESRQKRAEERRKLMEERAERAKLRELARADKSDSSDEEEKEKVEEEEEEEDDDDKSFANGRVNNFHVPHKKGQKRRVSRDEETKQNANIHLRKSSNGDNEYEITKNIQKRTRNTINTNSSVRSPVSLSSDKQWCRTYTRIKLQPTNEIKHRLKLTVSPEDYQFQFSESKECNTAAATHKESSSNHTTESTNSVSTNNEPDNVNTFVNKSFDNYSSFKTEVSSSKTNSSNLTNHSLHKPQDVNNKTVPTRVAVYKSNVLQNASDVAKWHAAFGSKTQKVHILHNAYDLTSKRIKLDQVKNIKTVSPNVKSLSKENHIYRPAHQSAFITYGKIIPTPAIVKLEYRKPTNPEVSS